MRTAPRSHSANESVRALPSRKRRPRPLILLVEDEDFVREAAAAILCEDGYEVLQARTYTEALNLNRSTLSRLCLLLTDIVLPDKCGQDLAADLLNLCPAMKVVLISGYPEKLVSKKSAKRFPCLAKPFSGENLKGFIRRALNPMAERHIGRRHKVNTA